MNFAEESFYPSISENLFQEAINFAKDMVNILDTELSVVKQARKTSMMIYLGLNFQEMKNSMYQWVHTMAQRSEDFLNKLRHVINKRFFGLYRDDRFFGLFRSFEKLLSRV